MLGRYRNAMRITQANGHKSLFGISTYTALRRSGWPGFARRAAPDWPSDHAVLMHAARGRWAAAAAQPEGLRLWAHGAVHAEILNRL
jgi:hypothetical protein